MARLLVRLWNEPALFLAALAAAAQALLLLPDWKLVIATIAATIAAGAGTRKLVTPTRGR